MSKVSDIQLLPDDYFRRLHLEEIFENGDEKPLEVDLGSGDGSFLIEMAANYGERNFLGVERLLGRARKICRKAARRGLENVKVLRLESAYTVEWLLPVESVSRLHLLFPDPWPKKRHHGRRLVNDDFLRGLLQVLIQGGEFLFKTDHAEYFEEACAHVEETKSFKRLKWLESGDFYADTDFEAQWRERGKVIHRSRWRKEPGDKS